MTFPADILTVRAMSAADAHAIQKGQSGIALMQTAGAALARAITSRFAARGTAVLCGPGNNGGDGWEVAQGLKAQGWDVTVFSLVERSALKGDAAIAASRWSGPVRPMETFEPHRHALVVDALFGAGLSRPLEGLCADIAKQLDGSDSVVVSADIPSGLNGDLGRASGPVMRADLTVTFHRLKPAHLLQPGRSLCGEIVLADIGIPDSWSASIPACAQVNSPDLWALPCPLAMAQTHKHKRGRLCVLSGPPGSTGAAVLSARAGLIGGAGFVTLLSGAKDVADLSLSEPSLVVRALDNQQTLGRQLDGLRANGLVLGPGGGMTSLLKAQVIEALRSGVPLVLDADALSLFENDPQALFADLHEGVVLTPHAGEFARLFPGLATKTDQNKIEVTQRAASICGAIILYKGADTVIATPDGRVRVNVHASPRLATAGTGDVLAGLIGSFLAQGMNAFDAASAGAFVHGEAGRLCGSGSTVNTVLAQLPEALARIRALSERRKAQQKFALQA